MQNNPHARVVRSIIKTAWNKTMVVGANIINSNNKETMKNV
jgi:hypothetical protein